MRLEDIINGFSELPNYGGHVEITTKMYEESRVRTFEIYLLNPEDNTFRTEYARIFIDDLGNAYIDATCAVGGMFTGASSTGVFQETVRCLLPEIMSNDGDKVRILFVDEAEKYALVEKITKAGAMETYRVFATDENPAKIIRA